VAARVTDRVLGVPIDVLEWATALDRIHRWAVGRESRYVCICNVHSVVTATRDPAFFNVIADADMATPDGAPIALMLRRQGHQGQQRIDGPDLMWRFLALAQKTGVGVYLLGGTPDTLARLRERLAIGFPGLRVTGAMSPPFRALTDEEVAAQAEAINGSGAGVVFVGLGCPKQEVWMSRQRGQVQAVMVGVGAAFDFHAGTLPRAPVWMRRHGLEWLHRLVSDPRRLWRRYLVTNSLFVANAVLDLLRRRWWNR
jgi:N-acetylglucosaminyldiphosphoundecaprenol N-acetyl-beta-D-mannosaminyltransferase